MTTKELREKYLNYFQEKNHVIMPSAPVVPENDPTTLFTGSGMQPMVPFLLGESHPLGTRLTDSQKCVRTQDIEDVGDNRHTTFFEMLGNWSLGDYFKAEQIPWMYTFLTKELGLDPARLYITCFQGYGDIPKDEEAAQLWQAQFAADGIEAKIVEHAETEGMQDGRIFYYDEKKNWWSMSGVPDKMPVGAPGGPDAEMFWDFGAQHGLHEISEWKEQPCHVNCDCGRFMEIGNNVFMQFKKTATGFEELPQKNIDFGGGLERLAAALNDDPDVFTIDLFDPIRAAVESISGKRYGEKEEETYAFRVIMDHLRAATFMIGDGAFPSNKDQGYFTRRMIRRAFRYARRLDIQDLFCAKVAEAVITAYDGVYAEIENQKEIILKVMNDEEEKTKKAFINGKKVFDKNKGAFAEIMGRMTAAMEDEPMKELATAAFDLYQTHGLAVEIFIEELDQLEGVEIPNKEKFENRLLAAYDEVFAGHQQKSREASAQKFKGGLADHSEMSVKYHTATHLLHAALQEVLGPHAVQKGSNITPERLRFDFAHPDKMTDEEKQRVEDLVNAAIQADYPVSYQEIPYDEAKKRGSIGLFEDNYGDVVKVYSIGDALELPKADPIAKTFSRELCGGPHVERTGVLGKFKIVKEEACSAGVRRVKGVLE